MDKGARVDRNEHGNEIENYVKIVSLFASSRVKNENGRKGNTLENDKLR